MRQTSSPLRPDLPHIVCPRVAYAVWEEALVDRYWFFPKFWEDSGVGTYSVIRHTNVLLAVHLSAFHTAISWLVPMTDRSEVHTRVLVIAPIAEYSLEAVGHLAPIRPVPGRQC